jgi:hypothetical protein
MSIKPTNNNGAGARIAQRRLPSAKIYMRKRQLSPQARLDKIEICSSAILDEDFSAVRKIVQLVATSNFEAQILDAARAAVRMIKPWHIDLKQNYRPFGFKRTVYPFQLGLLYEMLDRRIALPLFKQNFLDFITQDKILEGNQTLLCFSSALEAASFALKLWQEYPAQTDRLLSRDSKERRKYPFRGYERDVFKSLFDAKKLKAIK